MTVYNIISWTLLACIALMGLSFVFKVGKKTKESFNQMKGTFNNQHVNNQYGGYNQPGYNQPGYNQPGYNHPGYIQPGMNNPLNSPNYIPPSPMPNTVDQFIMQKRVNKTMQAQQMSAEEMRRMEIMSQQQNAIFNFYATAIQNGDVSIKPGSHVSKFSQFAKSVSGRIDYSNIASYIPLGAAICGNKVYWRYFNISQRRPVYIDWDCNDVTNNVGIVNSVDNFINTKYPEYTNKLNELLSGTNTYIPNTVAGSVLVNQPINQNIDMQNGENNDNISNNNSI